MKGSEETVAAAVMTGVDEGEEIILTYFADGRYFEDETNENDLLEVRPKVTGWINVYEKGRMHTERVSNVHPTKEAADRGAARGRIACVQITLHEGDGLEEETK